MIVKIHEFRMCAGGNPDAVVNVLQQRQSSRRRPVYNWNRDCLTYTTKRQAWVGLMLVPMATSLIWRKWEESNKLLRVRMSSACVFVEGDFYYLNSYLILHLFPHALILPTLLCCVQGCCLYLDTGDHVLYHYLRSDNQNLLPFNYWLIQKWMPIIP